MKSLTVFDWWLGAGGGVLAQPESESAAAVEATSAASRPQRAKPRISRRQMIDCIACFRVAAEVGL